MTFFLVVITTFHLHGVRVDLPSSHGPFHSFAACEDAGREIERRSRSVTNWYCALDGRSSRTR